MKKLFASAAFIVAFGGAALAADLPYQKGEPVYVPPPPVFTWTGVYVGADLGYQWGTATTGIYSAPGAFLGNLPNYGAHGVIGGAHAGYNYQIDQFVLGVEGDINGASYSGSQNVAFGVANVSTGENIEGSVRGRLGYAFDRALFYATGGAEIGSLQNSYSLVGTDSLHHTRVGWTVGGGIEYAIDTAWSVRAEYRYTDYGRYNDLLTNSTGGLLQARVHETENTVRVGFSYKFDLMSPLEPLVDKY
ncbi:MAG: outer membrane protein [Methylovirgula sp.]|jgi:outer membrane immunogenic protein